MAEITPERIEHLQRQFPGVDVKLLSTQVGSSAISPLAVLRSMCQAAAGKPKEAEEPKQQVFEHLDPEGSVFSSEVEAKTTADHFILDLLAMRRSPLGATPKAIAQWLGQFSQTPAFPLREKWLLYDEIWHWPAVPSSTSAEDIVKRATQTDRSSAVQQVTMWQDEKGRLSWPDDSPPASPEAIRGWLEHALQQFNMSDYLGGPAKAKR